ncbi:MAG: SDR family oxidoreductase [Pseudomonadota bacterium]|jgi:NAD(P)-dependent dehydrogenase (short-subunit alcohol dehydrogenase family)|nr:SDR family oxidoreductase [Pseudomonadota bacterium]
MIDSKVAVITAGGGGMGAAVTRELHQRGYRVALMSRSEAAEQLAAELGGVGLRGSVTDASALQSLVDETLSRFGRIDALVNHTAHPPKGELLDITDEQWLDGFDMLILNVVRMARLVTPPMLQGSGGAIVNITTFATFEPTIALPVSCTLRAGLSSFAKLYADRYAAEGIRMNNVLPGYIDSLAHTEETRLKIPMQRIGRSEEIAKTTAFLLSPDAGYITGQNIIVDGGVTRHV